MARSPFQAMFVSLESKSVASGFGTSFTLKNPRGTLPLFIDALELDPLPLLIKHLTSPPPPSCSVTTSRRPRGMRVYTIDPLIEEDLIGKNGFLLTGGLLDARRGARHSLPVYRPIASPTAVSARALLGMLLDLAGSSRRVPCVQLARSRRVECGTMAAGCSRFGLAEMQRVARWGWAARRMALGPAAGPRRKRGE